MINEGEDVDWSLGELLTGDVEADEALDQAAPDQGREQDRCYDQLEPERHLEGRGSLVLGHVRKKTKQLRSVHLKQSNDSK